MAKRGTVQERRIDDPILAFRVQEEVRLLKSEPEWKSGARDGITLAKYPHMRAVLVALKKGISMREHKVKGPMSLYVVSGNVTLIAGKQNFQLKEGGLFTLRKTILHDVQANADSVLLLTIVAL
jgi:quercetin dioxygenase-like cupin family protein